MDLARPIGQVHEHTTEGEQLLLLDAAIPVFALDYDDMGNSIRLKAEQDIDLVPENNSLENHILLNGKVLHTILPVSLSENGLCEQLVVESCVLRHNHILLLRSSGRAPGTVPTPAPPLLAVRPDRAGSGKSGEPLRRRFLRCPNLIPMATRVSTRRCATDT